MEIGILARTFLRPTLEETLDAVAHLGCKQVQFNFVCAGLPTLPEFLDPAVCNRIADAFSKRDLTMSAISGTFNMIHPDPERRRDNLIRLRNLAASCRRLGTSIITLCTGTRDRDSLWRWHDSNTSWAAWEDLIDAMSSALEIAEEHDVTLAFEPEVSNVIDSAREALRLIDRLGGPQPRLKVVIDPANLIRPPDVGKRDAILHEALSLLGSEVVLAHAKDLDESGRSGNVPAGRGVLDFSTYVALLRESGYDGPLILHGIDEKDASESVAFLRRILQDSGRSGKE